MLTSFAALGLILSQLKDEAELKQAAIAPSTKRDMASLAQPAAQESHSLLRVDPGNPNQVNPAFAPKADIDFLVLGPTQH